MNERLLREWVKGRLLKEVFPVALFGSKAKIAHELMSQIDSTVLSLDSINTDSGGFRFFKSKKTMTSDRDLAEKFAKAVETKFGMPLNTITITETPPRQHTASDLYKLYSLEWPTTGQIPAGNFGLVFGYKRGATPSERQGSGGYVYEASIRDKIKRSLPHKITLSPPTAAADILLSGPNCKIAIEAKKRRARGESSVLRWELGTGFIAADPSKKSPELLAVIDAASADPDAIQVMKDFSTALGVSNWGRVNNVRFNQALAANLDLQGKSSTQAKPTAKSIYAPIGDLSGEALNTYYANKDVQYIQIEGSGLYRTGTGDPLELGVPELSGITLKARIIWGSADAHRFPRINTQLKGTPVTSPFNLDSDGDLQTFMQKLTSLCESNILRQLIRESLLTEELTKSDKKEIEKISRKQAQKEITKVVGKDLDKTIKKAVEKVMKDKATKEEMAKISKAVLKKLYRDLAISYPQVIDRIKV